MFTNNQDSTLCTAMTMSTLILLSISPWSQALSMSSLAICQHTVINPVWFFGNSRLKESGVQVSPVGSYNILSLKRNSQSFTCIRWSKPASLELIPVSSHPPRNYYPSQALLTFPAPLLSSSHISTATFLSMETTVLG